MKKVILYIYLILLSPLLFTGCENEMEHKEEKTDRTILVYLGRDNNLKVEEENKIKYILQGWSGEGKLVFYEDKGNGSPCLSEAYTVNGENKLRTVYQYPEENSASPAVLKRAIEDTQNLYPSTSYGLIVFSHGTGWLPAGTKATTRSIIIDNKEEMEITDFASVIPNNMFDFIIFEACFMAGIEVAYELKYKTDYILCSATEILSPGFVHEYARSFDLLYKPTADLRSFAQAAVDRIKYNAGSFQSSTLSVIKTSELDALGNWIKLNASFNEQPDIMDIQRFDSYKNPLFFDFEDYFSRLVPEKSRKQLTSLINKVVIYENATPDFLKGYGGFEIKKHSGLTTYIFQDALPELNTEYVNLRWYREVLSKIN